jgi:hypothetical protein
MMLDNSEAIWYTRTIFDRKVAYPNENLFASALIINATDLPIFIGNCYWQFSCYPDLQPGVVTLNVSIRPKDSISVPSWRLPIPEIKEGKYEVRVSLDTWIWDATHGNWLYLGRIDPDRGEPFYIVHNPRFRAFISRSNRDIDRPIVESIISVIQSWGFDTHTVGVNEIEPDKNRVPDRIKEEITKADCVFAVATPRDVSTVPHLVRTLTWLHNEVSFSFMANKPTLLLADENVVLDGLIETNQIPTIKYSAKELDSFLSHLHQLMSVIRKILVDRAYKTWEQERIRETEEIRFQGFVTGMVYQKRLLLGE